MRLVNGTANGFENANGGDAMYARTRSQRIREAMFPEIEAAEEYDDQSAQTSSFFSIIELLAEPSKLLKTAVVDLLHVQDDSEAALRSLPDLIERLGHSDPRIVAEAAKMIYMLSRNADFLRHIADHRKLVDALIHAAKNGDENARGSVAATLCHISNHANGRLHIFRSGGIVELIRMLRSHEQSVVQYAVTTLHNLLVHLEDSKEDAIALGGIEALVPLLRSHDPKLLALVADSLHILLLDKPHCKQNFLSLSGPQALVLILQRHRSYAKLLYVVIRCIRSISISRDNKACLISLGAIETLHSVLPIMTVPKWRLALLQAVRNLSDCATNRDSLTGLIADLLILINESTDEECVSCACGILSNLTCNNSLNKQAVCANDGVRILSEALYRFAHIEDITEPALCTMRHCTARHASAQQAQEDVRNARAHQVILALLATRRPPIVKAALGLVRNCALSDINLQSMLSERTERNESIDDIAIEVLERSGTTLQNDFNALEDGVAILEMVEGAVAALHQLARDRMVARKIFLNPTLVSILIELMTVEDINTSEDDLMMREILGLVYQLTKTSEGAKIFESHGSHGPTPYIVDALRSQSKPIAAYASIILKNMSQNKPLEYRQRLQTEIASAHPHQHSNLGYNTAERGWVNDGLEPELFNEMYNYASLSDLHHDRMDSQFDTDL